MSMDKLITVLRQIAPDNHRCFGCSHENHCGIHGCAIIRLAADAIGRLQSELEQVKAERDAAVTELNNAQPCFACFNFHGNNGKCFGAGACRSRLIYEQAGLPLPHQDLSHGRSWQWRGMEGR